MSRSAHMRRFEEKTREVVWPPANETLLGIGGGGGVIRRRMLMMELPGKRKRGWPKLRFMNQNAVRKDIR